MNFFFFNLNNITVFFTTKFNFIVTFLYEIAFNSKLYANGEAYFKIRDRNVLKQSAKMTHLKLAIRMINFGYNSFLIIGKF